jgi:hypothetical protein
VFCSKQLFNTGCSAFFADNTFNYNDLETWNEGLVRLGVPIRLQL